MPSSNLSQKAPVAKTASNLSPDQLPTFHHLGGLKMRPLCLLGQKMDCFDGHTFHSSILPFPYLEFTDKEFRHDFGSTPP